ncbi:MAG: protein translocase subunit SecD [Clostridia bacterium]|jgi:preprotein translocase subunit SecD|nr:protein translocase subunit SecD [Clostridia bacterium]
MGRGRFVIVMLITILTFSLTYVAFDPLKDNARLGLDLRGGVQVRLEAPTGSSDDDLERAVAIISNRIDGLGVAEPDIRREGANRILVELPGVDNPDEAITLIGKTALLEFKRADTLETVVTGKDLKDAKEAMNPNEALPQNKYYVGLQFNEEGAKKFAEATKDLVEKYPNTQDPNRVIAIFLDNQLIGAPTVNEAIPNGQAQISGGFATLDDARNQALLLRSGALPVELKIIEKRTVGPTLGLDSIVKSQEAAILGIGLLFAFMIIYYRVPGLVAVLSLILYAVLLWGSLVLIKATITLPGIAGFLLSIGIAVDANIIIYERIKEELKNGKSLRASIDAGFSRAFVSILDANVTTLIATVVLMYFGTGAIRGFAVTLSIGIVISMLTAILFTRFILKQLALSNVVKNTKLYGA